MVAFVKNTKTKTQFWVPLQESSLQLTQRIYIKPSHTPLRALPCDIYMEFVNLLDFPDGSAGKESTCNAGDLASISGLEDSLEKGPATHYSILAWRIPWTV